MHINGLLGVGLYIEGLQVGYYYCGLPGTFKPTDAKITEIPSGGKAIEIKAEGALLNIERSEYATAHAESAWQIVGTKGALNLVMTAGQEKQIVFDEAVPGKGVAPRTIWQGTDDATPILSGPVLDFAAAILANRAPKTTLEQYLTIQKIFDAIYQSSACGKAITIQ